MVEDVDYWLRVLSAPRPAAETSKGDDATTIHLPPPLEPPKSKRVGKPEHTGRQPEVDSIDYWLREMSRKRPKDE
jgi:hypothetical protein